MILFINACVRKKSRTKRLADYFLSKCDSVIEEIKLCDIKFPVASEDYLRQRDRLISKQKFDDAMFSLARQFASAEEIVIAAPFWDLSFPAALKQYFEQINVIGITFGYTEDGKAKGLCKAKKLTFITTAGGDFFPEEFGFGYVKALADNFYEIKNVKLIKAVGLDIYGADVEKILKSAEEEIEKNF